MDPIESRLIQERVATKVQWAAACGSLAGLYLASVKKGPIIQYTVTTCASFVTAIACFSVVQEGVRYARGTHDAYNSALAGGLGGAALVGTHAGPRYRIFGALAWSSICGATHWVYAKVQPGKLIEDALIHAELLDVADRRTPASTASSDPTPHQGQRQGGAAAPALTSIDEIPAREKLNEIQKIRMREMQQLRAQITGGGGTGPGARGVAGEVGSSGGKEEREQHLNDITNGDKVDGASGTVVEEGAGRGAVTQSAEEGMPTQSSWRIWWRK